jgi:crotonobetainyl-CoA:carnitine CoA-transferase CaiB-like acyl-CoA transferase
MTGGPLQGIRVVDFGQYLAGPFGPMILSDLGADVIKVEPLHADGMRANFIGPFSGCQRGKRDIALNIKHPDGLRLALELVATADVVHHNMTLGTAEKLGVGYEHCKAVKPDILYCNNFMYGPIGDLAPLGGLDPLGQAASGIEWEQGPVAEGNPPQWYRYGHGDIASAFPSVLAVLMALWHRNRTGEGQYMWSSILNGSMLYTADSWLDADGNPSPRPTLDKEQLGLSALYRLYETKDGWLQLAAVRDDHWRALCAVIGRDDLASDERFATPAARQTNRAALTGVLTDVFRTDHAVNWRRALDGAGVPSEVSADTLDGETILFDDELLRLDIVAEYDHQLLGRVRQFGNLITFSDTATRQERPAPLLGEHTREILGELGYDAATIDELGATGVVSWPDEAYPYRL